MLVGKKIDINKSDPIATNQSVAVMAAKVITDTDQRKSIPETSVDTNNDHMMISSHLASVTCCSVHIV